MHTTRTKKRPRRVKKWLLSPHNKFKRLTYISFKSPSNDKKESSRSQQNSTKVYSSSNSASIRYPTILIGVLIIFINVSLSCYCSTLDPLSAVGTQPSQAKSLITDNSVHLISKRPLEEEEVTIVHQQKQANQTANTFINATSANLVTSVLPVNTSTLASPSGDRRRARRRPRVFRLRAAPTNGRLTGPVVKLELTDALERLPARLVGTSQLPESVAVEQFGARTAGVKTASLHQVKWPIESQREQKMLRPNQEQVANSSTEPCPPNKSPQPESGSFDKINQPTKQVQQSTSVAASSPMLRLTPSQQQLASALAAASSPNNTQQVGLTQVSLTEEGTARSDGESTFSLIDEYDSKIITNRTRAQLSCDSGEMVLRLNFSDPFKGIVYPERNRLSPCRFFGDGHNNYELRLPLRGCGTRQAAPRVFVNDVIVRFHKSLELEEDEVKTLICRYPPPLAPSPQLADGSAQGDQRGTTAATIITTSTTEGTSGEQEGSAQFEFVDSAYGRPEPVGSSGNVDTSSENLVIAPNVHQQQQQQQQQQMDAGYANRLGPIRQQPQHQSDLFNQRNSPLLDSSGVQPSGSGRIASMTNQQQQDSGGFSLFSGLSSIELLFLISTLMFLVLLALGLTASYYCFRRHNNRRSTDRASAILKRKRRYVSPANLLSAHQAAVANMQPPTGSAVMQQHYYPANGQSRQQPSSPDSDLSARSLLAGSNTAGSHYAPTNVRHYALNRGFVPDTGPKPIPLPKGTPSRGQYLTSSAPYKPQVIGRRGEATYMQSGTGYLQPHYLASHQSAINSQFSPMQPARVGMGPGYATGRKHFNQWPLYLVNDASTLNKQGRGASTNYVAQAQSLSRAKSMSSVNNHDALQRQWDSTGGRRAQPATLNRNNRWTSEYADRSISTNLTGVRRYVTDHSLNDYEKQSRDGLDRLGKVDHEMNNNQTTEHIKYPTTKRQAQHHKPKIVLKSIEDSFITNVTEIHEQEYVKRNSLRPLDLEEWRAMQPHFMKKVARTGRGHNRRSGSASDNSGEGGTSGDDLLPPPPPPPLASDRHQELNKASKSELEEEEFLHHSDANTNLRSLTELDVNFARSLLSGPSLALPRAASTIDAVILRPAISADHLDQTESHISSRDRKSLIAKRERRASSVPEVTAAEQICDERPSSESPDLILSPEYDCSRLELVKPKSSSSHNSVSYV